MAVTKIEPQALTQPLTQDAFKAFIALPENADRLFEWVNGEIIEQMPGCTLFSEFTHAIIAAVWAFCQAHNLPYHTSGEAGAYDILGNVFVPDFAYKRTPMSADYPDPVPPLWVVEVISPTDKATDIRAMRKLYQAAGILLWEVYGEDHTVDVYLHGQPERIEYGIDAVLNAADVLPGFSLPVKAIFRL
jgi:Uma2 family endonuclease